MGNTCSCITTILGRKSKDTQQQLQKDAQNPEALDKNPRQSSIRIHINQLQQQGNLAGLPMKKQNIQEQPQFFSDKMKEKINFVNQGNSQVKQAKNNQAIKAVINFTESHIIKYQQKSINKQVFYLQKKKLPQNEHKSQISQQPVKMQQFNQAYKQNIKQHVDYDQIFNWEKIGKPKLLFEYQIIST